MKIYKAIIIILSLIVLSETFIITNHSSKSSKSLTDIPSMPNTSGFSFVWDGKTVGLSYNNDIIFFEQAGPTDSMIPVAPPGSTSIVTTKFDRYALKVGQIVTYVYKNPSSANNGAKLSHRIIGISKASDGKLCYIIKGDNVGQPDGCISPEDIGTVTLGIIYGTISRPEDKNSWWSQQEPYKSTPINYSLCSKVVCIK